MSKFTNKVIKGPRKDKPHIIFIGGYWRVSSAAFTTFRHYNKWADAHKFANKLNWS